jgi:hypothetical protein
MGSEEMANYAEAQPAAWWVRLSLIIGALIMIAAALVLWAEPAAPLWMRVMFTVLAPVMVWLALAFKGLDIVVADGKLVFGWGPFRPSVALADIEEVSREPITFARYGGVGIRLGQGAVCYNARFGEGLRIKVAGRKRDYVFTTDHPEEVAAALGHPISERLD